MLGCFECWRVASEVNEKFGGGRVFARQFRLKFLVNNNWVRFIKWEAVILIHWINFIIAGYTTLDSPHPFQQSCYQCSPLLEITSETTFSSLFFFFSSSPFSSLISPRPMKSTSWTRNCSLNLNWDQSRYHINHCQHWWDSITSPTLTSSLP